MKYFSKCRGINCPHDKLKCKRYLMEAGKMGQAWMDTGVVRKGKCLDIIKVQIHGRDKDIGLTDIFIYIYRWEIIQNDRKRQN